MASEESLEFSTESFLDSVLSELDKLGISNPMPNMPAPASIIHDMSIPASGQSNKHVEVNQEERRNSEVDDFELIDLIESHMTEYGGTVDSVSPTLEAGSPLNGSVFESISPLNESFRCLTASGEDIYGEQSHRLENSDPQIVMGLEDGILSYTEDGTASVQEIAQSHEVPADDVEQMVRTQTIAPDVTGIVEARDEAQTAQQPSAETVDAKDAVRVTIEMEDDAPSNVLESESAARGLEPSVEGDAAEMNDEVPTTDLTASDAAVTTASDDVVPIKAAAEPVQESDVSATEPEVAISTLDHREDVHDPDGVRNGQTDSSLAVVAEDDFAASADEEMANGAPMGGNVMTTMAKDSTTLTDVETPAGSVFTIRSAEESSTETKECLLPAEPVPELVTTGEKSNGVAKSYAESNDETVLESETAKPVVEVVAEPALAPESANVSEEPEAFAEPATESSADLKDIELKDPVPSEASIQGPESTIFEQPTRSSLAAPATSAPSAVDEDSKVYIYTSFTGGGMFGRNIMTATNRLQLILKSNGIAFELVDLATNERAKKLWARSSRGKKLPGVVKGKDIVGNYEEIEDANEFGELQQLIAEFV
ncbi:hypothetical protein POJ06DRAFT_222513 [Lipomyces tetrasporus]|uniref:Glutaredoxin domain-containing protein n=1 Tax=Lipomyces tetrasporus TaxID=54092 RepID=A0AAD7QSD4_9ASCO|nr:uncharacterized protein POJ06DRAFT_222513 [Lipomyces tetrasporus]KAJ8100396.1 hypothetical protein POJ06DRAFT_222513 [Lipomyces tetrasporus]